VCEDCRGTLQPEESLGEVNAVKAWAQKETSLWPQIKSRLLDLEHAKAAPKKTSVFYPFKIRRWATTFVALMVLVVVSFLMQKEMKRAVSSEEEPLTKSPTKVIVKRAELKGKKARPIIYQTPNVSIIYLVEDKKNGG